MAKATAKVRAWLDRDPLAGFRRGVRQSNVEGHHTDTAVHHGADQTVRHRCVVRMGLEAVGPEVQHEPRVVEVPVVVVAAPGQLLAGPLRGLADGRVVPDGSRAVGGQEDALDELAGARLHASVVEHELLGLSVVAQLLEPAGELIERLVPGYPFPFTFSARADPTQGIEHAIGVVDLIDARLGLGAERALGPDRVELPADLNELAVLHIADDRAAAHALPAGAGDGRLLLAGPRREVLAAFQESGLNLDRRCASGQAGGRRCGSELQKITTSGHFPLLTLRPAR